MMDVLRISPGYVHHNHDLVHDAKKEGVLMSHVDVMFGVFDGNQIMGFGGIVLYTNNAVFKSDYVLPEYRGRGLYRKITEARMDYITQKGIKKVEARCTQNSLPMFVNMGFVEKHYWPGEKVTLVEKHL